jgi:hypothetical protein
MGLVLGVYIFWWGLLFLTLAFVGVFGATLLGERELEDYLYLDGLTKLVDLCDKLCLGLTGTALALGASGWKSAVGEVTISCFFCSQIAS